MALAYTQKIRYYIPAVVLLVLAGIWYFSLPGQLFPTQYSTVMYDSDGRLLNARVASDGQWRFPPDTTIPYKYQVALLTFEDRYFFYHPGFNPLAMGRAMWQNLQSGQVKSGASTLSMQLIRLSRRGKARTLREKFVELFLATRLEWRYSKQEILALYAAHAPFGGNVVGLQAASWRYFGQHQRDLSWAEAATLAVLPNSPSLIFPGRNQELLLQKRNRLLHTLHQRSFLDELDLQLALAEPLPSSPYSLPQKAPHLFTRSMNDGLQGQQIHTTIDADLQNRVASVMLRHHPSLRGNHVHNIAVLVAHIETGNVLAYWGNTPAGHTMPVSAREVDVIASRRSPGSLLKPFLYAGMLQDGKILPHSLVPDIPTYFQGFHPQNYHRTYDGAVPASRALARSLNVPAVRMLMEYRSDKFLDLLQKCGMHTFDQPASHYGLSLILGGAEVNMWEIAGTYASMGRSLQQFNPETPVPNNRTFFPLSYLQSGSVAKAGTSPFSAGVIWHTLEAMVEAARPDTEANWQRFAGSRKIAWKTGTSYGNRDAWAIGIDPGYVVAVWAGNATGEGRPGLTGIAAAAPVMFDVFHLLQPRGWFQKPYESLFERVLCAYSGYPASDICPKTDSLQIPTGNLQTGTCPYHLMVHLDKSQTHRVNSNCVPWSEITTKPWFVLPPVQEYYFKQRNPFYKPLPAFSNPCQDQPDHQSPMQWIYPTESTIFFIPHQMDGTASETIFKIAHRHENTTVYWHLNEAYLGATNDFHEMAIQPKAGKHRLTLTDENGHMLHKEFTIRRRSR